MSDSGPKSKDTGSKIKFFKIDQGGDISAAFPKHQRDNKPAAGGDTFSQIEPVFEPLAMSDESQPAIVLENKQDAATPPETETQLEEQIHLLRPQVEDIARMPGPQSLSSDQVDILKKYIALKESEVRDVREQHRQYQTYLKKVNSQLEGSTRKTRELLEEIESLKRRAESLKAENHELRETHQNEILLIKNDYEEKLRSSVNYETQVDELMRKREEWREKVKADLKRIKLKERELENKYELLKRDTQALLDSKDKHVLELKKKNDALELELEGLEDRLRKNNTVLGGIDAKKRRLVETLRLGISLLEEIDNSGSESDSEPGRKVG